MANEDLILDKLTEIANKLDEQNLLQKTVYPPEQLHLQCSREQVL
jgi:hypothetical protein